MTPTARLRGVLALGALALVGTAACGTDPKDTAAVAGQAPPPATSTVVSTTTATATPTSAPATSMTAPVDACQNPPEQPEQYADTFVRAWGVGDRTTMDCLASPEAVQYAVDYRSELGPGWTQLRSNAEGMAHVVEYGSPNRKTVAQVTVDGDRLTSGGAHAVVTVRIG